MDAASKSKKLDAVEQKLSQLRGDLGAARAFDCRFAAFDYRFAVMQQLASMCDDCADVIDCVEGKAVARELSQLCSEWNASADTSKTEAVEQKLAQLFQDLGVGANFTTDASEPDCEREAETDDAERGTRPATLDSSKADEERGSEPDDAEDVKGECAPPAEPSADLDGWELTPNQVAFVMRLTAGVDGFNEEDRKLLIAAQTESIARYRAMKTTPTGKKEVMGTSLLTTDAVSFTIVYFAKCVETAWFGDQEKEEVRMKYPHAKPEPVELMAYRVFITGDIWEAPED